MLNVTGEGLTFDKLDNNNNGDNLIYFQLNSTQIPSGAQFVRVSAASLSDDCLPPPLFARLTYLPSRSLFDYNGTMSQVSQVLLNVKDHRPEDWLVAVEANCQFVIWAGGPFLFSSFLFFLFLILF